MASGGHFDLDVERARVVRQLEGRQQDGRQAVDGEVGEVLVGALVRNVQGERAKLAEGDEGALHGSAVRVSALVAAGAWGHLKLQGAQALGSEAVCLEAAGNGGV